MRAWRAFVYVCVCVFIYSIPVDRACDALSIRFHFTDVLVLIGQNEIVTKSSIKNKSSISISEKLE